MAAALLSAAIVVCVYLYRRARCSDIHLVMIPLKHPLPLSQLIRENLGIVMTFMYSKKRIDQFAKEHFFGVWKDLEAVLHQANEKRALQACLEMALYLRALDDETGVSRLYKEVTKERFGKVFYGDGSINDLPLRQLANKIIHAETLTWDFDTHPDPILICTPKAPFDPRDPWARAEIYFPSLILLVRSMIYTP